tara:strand:+ start:736 stop:918 length:183 start_codon:yes stop_codon:yes gene_type:complete
MGAISRVPRRFHRVHGLTEQHQSLAVHQWRFCDLPSDVHEVDMTCGIGCVWIGPCRQQWL